MSGLGPDLDADLVLDLALEMRDAAPANLSLLPSEALAVVGAIQLALRHPDVPGNTAAIAIGFVAEIAQAYGPVFRRVVDEGWRA